MHALNRNSQKPQTPQFSQVIFILSTLDCLTPKYLKAVNPDSNWYLNTSILTSASTASSAQKKCKRALPNHKPRYLSSFHRISSKVFSREFITFTAKVFYIATSNLTIFSSPVKGLLKLPTLGLEEYAATPWRPCLKKFRPFGIVRQNFYSGPKNMDKELIFGRSDAFFMNWFKEKLCSKLNRRLGNFLRSSKSSEPLT